VGNGINRAATAAVVLATSISVSSAAGDPRDAFVKRWQGQGVVLTQTLYTLVYDERSRIGVLREGKREGLVVVTPFEGSYLQFDGRRGRDDVKATEPQRLRDAVATAYMGDALLELEASRTIQPIVVNRHDAGVQCVVSKVLFDRYTVRLVLASAGGANADPDPLTSLTVKWPVPLSKSLNEQDTIEGLIRRFVQTRQTR
jgi:hypothetical protein